MPNILIFDSVVFGSPEAMISLPANCEEAWELVDLDLMVEVLEIDGVLFLFCDG